MDAILGPGYVKIATVYVALFTTTPSPTFAGIEVNGGSYSRVAVPNDIAHWPPATTSQKVNALVIAFPQPTSDWGSITTYGLFDDPLSGTIICYGDLQTPTSVLTGVVAQFAAGSLVITAT